MTATLMGRLFVVPGLLVVVLLGVAVVLILFGASPIEKPRSVDELLTQIESDTGSRALGGTVLPPRAKQTWQAAQELAMRVDAGDIDPADVSSIVERMLHVIESRQGSAVADDLASGLPLQQFLIVAVGKLRSPQAVGPMLGLLDDPNAEIRRVALHALADMREVAGVRSSVGTIAHRVRDESKEVRIVAALAVAAIAPRGDRAAIDAITNMPAMDGETQMNRATALAKLGDAGGKLMLLNMLDREFWRKVRPSADDIAAPAGALSEGEISARLIVLAPIAAGLGDADVRASLERLAREDAAPQVRDAVRAALSESAADGVGSQSGARALMAGPREIEMIGQG